MSPFVPFYLKMIHAIISASMAKSKPKTKPATKLPAKIGRPSKYPEAMKLLPEAFEEMKEGASITEVAAIINVHRDTIYDWLQDPEKQEFSDTIKKGLRLCEAWWEKHGRKEVHNKDFNSTLWYMNMRNRFGWRDKQEISIDEDLKNAIKVYVPEEDEAE